VHTLALENGTVPYRDQCRISRPGNASSDAVLLDCPIAGRSAIVNYPPVDLSSTWHLFCARVLRLAYRWHVAMRPARACLATDKLADMIGHVGKEIRELPVPARKARSRLSASSTLCRGTLSS
jgi:hypothetical protein